MPAFAKTAVMLTKVGGGESPPPGRTKCQATALSQPLDALTVLALPRMVVVVVAPPVMVPTPAVPRPMNITPAAAIAAPVVRATDPFRRTPPSLIVPVRRSTKRLCQAPDGGGMRNSASAYPSLKVEALGTGPSLASSAHPF